MTPRRRARRALLFAPGTERRKIDKAAALGADAVILDWEDAAALARKAEARATTVAALAALDFGHSERIVRVNPVGSGLEGDDLAALEAAPRPPDAVLLPKTEHEDQVRWLADRLARVERRAGLPAGALRVLALVETARGVTRLREIAAADARLDALAFGAEDLAADLGAVRTPGGDEIAFARSALVVHAAAASLQAIESPYVVLDDVDDLVRDTRRAMEQGFTGRLAIHPRQVAPIVGVFTPAADELARAERLIAEHERHQREGRGVFELDGRMVDMPMVRAAERVVARARNAGLR